MYKLISDDVVIEKQRKKLYDELKRDFDLHFEKGDILIYPTSSYRKYTPIQLFIGDKNVILELSKSWPFHPPKNVYINGKSVKLELLPIRLADSYRIQYNRCPCCACHILGRNWNITITVKQIIDQYITIKQRLWHIYYKKWGQRFIPDVLPICLKDNIISFL